jgi:uncharacterized protein involved in exopolysaccharide biosynthesis
VDQQDAHGDVAEWAWLDGIEAIWRARYLVIAAALGAGVLTAVVVLLIPRTYVAVATLKVGKVTDRLIADPLGVSVEIGDISIGSRLAKAGFTDRTPEEFARDVAAAVRVQVIGNTTTPSQFVTVTANGDSPESAKRLVLAAAQVIVDDHQKRFDAWMTRLGVFREQIDRQIAAARSDIAEIDAALKDFRTKPTVSAPAVLLMRAQLEEKQSQLLGFLRELRDLDVNLTVQSERTVVVADPLVPKDRMRPRRTITTLAGAVSGFVLAVLWAVGSDARRRPGRTARSGGAR